MTLSSIHFKDRNFLIENLSIFPDVFPELLTVIKQNKRPVRFSGQIYFGNAEQSNVKQLCNERSFRAFNTLKKSVLPQKEDGHTAFVQFI